MSFIHFVAILHAFSYKGSQAYIHGHKRHEHIPACNRKQCEISQFLMWGQAKPMCTNSPAYYNEGKGKV